MYARVLSGTRGHSYPHAVGTANLCEPATFSTPTDTLRFNCFFSSKAAIWFSRIPTTKMVSKMEFLPENILLWKEERGGALLDNHLIVEGAFLQEVLLPKQAELPICSGLEHNLG